MASFEQVHSEIVRDGQLDYILQPVREYGDDEFLLEVAQLLRGNNDPGLQFAGEVLVRAVETRQKMDGS